MTGSAEQLPPLRTALDPGGPWDAVREDLAASGSALVYCTLGAWAGQLAEPPRFRPVLGRDWLRYQSLSHPRAQERFLASRLLLRQAAAAAIETGPELVDLAYQPGGRPYVRGCDQIDISLSHTEEVVVVGVTRRGRIGVDVELADRRMAGTGSETQGFTRYELDRVDQADCSLRNDTLVRLWTLKEAYSKALGQGLRFRFTEFGFALDGDEARLVQPGGEPVRGGSAWTFGTFSLEQRYVVSVAVHDAGFGDSVDLSVGTALDEGLLDALLRASDRF
ncbi:4'-phosphopantetheinyl transferase family protein [Streptacidiphilus griseoplanus]|uniref:4'-phosphopantetheinyl transferase family protein n=1 Tax=Peterkaempfera griseoplana TaxID=66896 RepID=UPI0006E179B0|nr:4'-phosphopantetheinyl transferase superfamily protein [Peterkaempfera griseoplana]